MSLYDRVEFWMISFMHDTIYGLFMDAEKLLIPAGLKEGDQVIEAGCGPGFFTIPAAKMVGENGFVYAIDINPFAIKKVEKKIRKVGAKNIKAMLVDITETTLEENSIDIAFFFGVIHSLVNIIDKVKAEMSRILKDDGTIVIQKTWKSKESIIEEITKEGLFKLIEEKRRLLIFKRK